MNLTEQTDHYGVLDLKPDATPTEIREAYFRVKATYQKDNVALYTLIDAGDREEMLKQIEEAYQILSNPDRRREYDRFYGQLGDSPFETVAEAAPEPAKIISIDRVPPMESARNSEEMLIPPKTDFGFSETPAASPAPLEPSAMKDMGPPSASAVASTPLSPSAPKVSGLYPELENEIRDQTEWSGHFLRKVREARGISLEELMQATKITKAYILAIEEENFPKLPAPVFIRGFVAQIARLLKLPHQQVAASYMTRLQRANPEKFK